jgi:hypothetical protein
MTLRVYVGDVVSHSAAVGASGKHSAADTGHSEGVGGSKRRAITGFLMDCVGRMRGGAVSIPAVAWSLAALQSVAGVVNERDVQSHFVTEVVDWHVRSGGAAAIGRP